MRLSPNPPGPNASDSESTFSHSGSDTSVADCPDASPTARLRVSHSPPLERRVGGRVADTRAPAMATAVA
eukprot:6177816-Alexandrium_andersonii.AAC.1